MSRTYVSPGDVVEYAHTSGVTVGVPIVVGRQLFVPLGTYGANVLGAYAISGVHALPAVNGQVFAIGNQAIWDASGGAMAGHGLTLAAGDLSVACIAMESKTAGANDTIKVKLNVGVGTVT